MGDALPMNTCSQAGPPGEVTSDAEVNIQMVSLQDKAKQSYQQACTHSSVIGIARDMLVSCPLKHSLLTAFDTERLLCWDFNLIIVGWLSLIVTHKTELTEVPFTLGERTKESNILGEA